MVSVPVICLPLRVACLIRCEIRKRIYDLVDASPSYTLLNRSYTPAKADLLEAKHPLGLPLHHRSVYNIKTIKKNPGLRNISNVVFLDITSIIEWAVVPGFYFLFPFPEYIYKVCRTTLTGSVPEMKSFWKSTTTSEHFRRLIGSTKFWLQSKLSSPFRIPSPSSKICYVTSSIHTVKNLKNC